MGKVDRIRNRVEPFAALFWAFEHPVCRPGMTPRIHKASPFLVQFSMTQTRCPPSLSYLDILFIYASNITQIFSYLLILSGLGVRPLPHNNVGWSYLHYFVIFENGHIDID